MEGIIISILQAIFTISVLTLLIFSISAGVYILLDILREKRKDKAEAEEKIKTQKELLRIQKVEIDEKVKCEICKCYLDKQDAQEIKVECRVIPFYRDSNDYYCPIHKRNYNRRIIEEKIKTNGNYLFRFFKEFEVDEDGKLKGRQK